MTPIRTLRALQAAPDELLCTDPQIAAEHQLRVPFWVTRIIWKGGGVVSVEFVSNHEHHKPLGGHNWGATGYTSLKHLFVPDSGQTPSYRDVPEPGPAWESAEHVVRRLLD